MTTAFRSAQIAGRLSVLLALLALSGCRPPPRDLVQGYVEGEFVYVASPLSGTLTTLAVQRGAQVKSGDLLFSLDDTMEEAARDQAKTAITLSEVEMVRQEKLFRMGPGAAQDLDRARAARDQDKQRLTQAEWNLAQKQQAAPGDAFVYDTLFRRGEWVAAGKPIVSLLPPQNIKVRAFVPETWLGGIHVGDTVRVSVDGAAQEFAGRISYISPRAEYTPPVIYSKESREKLVYLIEIIFEPESAARLHPGQPVDVRFDSRS